MQTKRNIARLDSNRGIEYLEIRLLSTRPDNDDLVIDCEVTIVDSYWSEEDPQRFTSCLENLALSLGRLETVADEIDSYVELPVDQLADQRLETTIDLALAPAKFEFRFGNRGDTISGIGKSTLTLAYSQGDSDGELVLVTDPTVLKAFSKALRNAIADVTKV